MIIRPIWIGISDARKSAMDKAREKGVKHSVYVFIGGERWAGYYRVFQGDGEMTGMTLCQTFEPPTSA